MKATIQRSIILCAMVVAIAGASVIAQQPTEVLSNSSIIKLVRAGFKEKTVIAIIHSRPNKFDLSPDRLIELKHSGVSENVILAMLSQDSSDFSADDLGDDAFFKRNDKSSPDNDGEKKSDGTSIFGSGGSSKGEVHGRGRNGATDDNTQTNGSATVRILRPPVEQGSPPVKLEKTPTLDNAAIINLVEAGFSDGTILKRIEQSPVEFDLSPAKLTELRKHRVSEPVLAAMSAAMGEPATPRANATEKSREN
jgi:hypothetical protein